MPYADITQQRAAQAAHQRKKKAMAKAFAVKAKSRPCTDCGVSYPPCVMQFDHVRGVKKDTVNALLRAGTYAAAKLEILKCEVVCANCHALRTEARRLHALVVKPADTPRSDRGAK